MVFPSDCIDKKQGTFKKGNFFAKVVRSHPTHPSVTPLRAISTLPNSAKVFESIIYSQVNDYMENKFLKYLSGFRKNHDTQNSLLITFESWVQKYITIDQKKLIFCSFIKLQFTYYPLIWMFCTKRPLRRINNVNEPCLRLIQQNYRSAFVRLFRALSKHFCWPPFFMKDWLLWM